MGEKIIAGGWSYPYASSHGDRAYTEADYALFFGLFFSRGVVANMLKGDGLQVTATNPPSLQLKLGVGAAVCGDVERRGFYNSTEKKITLDIPLSAQARTDSVVIRHSAGDRQSYPVYKPNDTRVIRSEDVYEIKICEITIPANAGGISQALIKDTRADPSVCGFSSPYGQLKTGDLLAQFNADLERKDGIFDGWFNNLKNMLNTNQASNLQNQIDKLNAEGQPGRFRVYDDLNTVPTGLDVFWKEYPLKNTPADMQGGGLVQTFKKDKEAFQIAIGFDVDKSPSFRWKWLEKWTAWQSFVSTDENDIVKVKKLKAEQLEVTGYKIINNFQLGYGRTGTLMRVGNMVFLNSQGQYLYGKTNANNQWLTINEKIPAGYRPIVGLQATSFSLGNPDKRTHNDIATNGDMRLHTGTGWGEDEWFIMPQVSWATNDPFPE